MQFFRFLLLNVFLLFSLVGTTAYAQGSNPPAALPDVSSHTERLDTPNMMVSISNAITRMLDKAKTYGSKLAGLGRATLYSLMALAISFYIVSVLLEGGDLFANIHNAIRALVYFGCVNLVLTNYASGGIWDVSSWPTSAQATILNTLEVTSAGGAPHSVMWDPIMRIFDVAGRLWDWMLVEVRPSGGVLDKIISVFSMLLFILPTLIMVMGAIFILILCALIIAGTYVTSQIVLAVGVALGPIFIPFMILRQTSFIASGWVSFMITAMLNSIVTPFLIKLCDPLIETLMGLMSQNAELANGASMFSLSCAVLLTTLIMYSLVLKAESIAGGLLSGNGAFGFSPRSALGVVGAGKAVGSLAKGTTSAAASGAKAGGAAAIGAARSVASGVGAASGLRQSAGSTGSAISAAWSSAKERAQGAINSAKTSVKGTPGKMSNMGGIKDAFNQGRTAAYQGHMYKTRY